MKLLILGHKGWIGQKYVKNCQEQNIEYITTELRSESDELLKFILESKCSHIISCIGRTHGTLNNKKYTTIDYLEHNETLYQNINDNLFCPLKLALFCDKNNIHFTYIGTGCIYSYDGNHKDGFLDNDKPNFFGSNYSTVKGFTNELMKYTNTLVLKIRMPITDEKHPRNFITKITTYEKICSISNSMSVLNDLIPLSIKMMNNKEIGLFNFTNPGLVSHNEILEMYREIVDNNFTWKNFTIEEQDKILLSKRSNNYLNTNKLESKYDILSIKESVRNILVQMKLNLEYSFFVKCFNTIIKINNLSPP